MAKIRKSANLPPLKIRILLSLATGHNGRRPRSSRIWCTSICPCMGQSQEKGPVSLQLLAIRRGLQLTLARIWLKVEVPPGRGLRHSGSGTGTRKNVPHRVIDSAARRQNNFRDSAAIGPLVRGAAAANSKLHWKIIEVRLC